MPLGASFGSEQHRSYLAPFFVYGLPVDVVHSQEETQARYAESGERRVMISSNSDGRAYSRGEFLEHFGKAIGLREWEKAVPVLAPSFHHMMGRRPLPEPGSLDTDKDVSGVFNDIKRALMRLLDEAEKTKYYGGGSGFGTRRLRGASSSGTACVVSSWSYSSIIVSSGSASTESPILVPSPRISEHPMSHNTRP